MSTNLTNFGYKVRLEHGQIIFDDVTRNDTRSVSVRVQISQGKTSTLLTAREEQGGYRDADHFTYKLEFNEETSYADILGWFSIIPDYVAISVLKYFRQHSRLSSSNCQSAYTDLINVNPWTHEYMSSEEQLEYSNQEIEKQESQLTSSDLRDNRLSNWPPYREGEAYQGWRRTGLGAEEAAEELYGIPDSRLVEE